MELPKITFRAMTFEENMDMIAMFVNQETTRPQKPNTDYFRNHYVELANVEFTKNMTREQISELLKSILFDSWNKDMESSDKKIKDIQNDWDLINDDVMTDLSKRLNIAWSEDTLDIQARVGIMYFCPRYISHRMFDTSINADKSRMRSVAIHEICHFLYFEKWKELYNDHDERHYNRPNIAWYLSEAIIDPLLNNETFIKYTNQELKSNRDMGEIEVDGKSIVSTLREIVNSNQLIEDAIKQGFEYFSINEDLIKGSSNTTQVKKR